MQQDNPAWSGSRCRLRPDALCQAIDDEAVALNAETGRYYQLSPVGLLLWRRLERSASVADLARLLIDTYQIDLERASQDAERFLWELSAAELIVNE